MADSDSVTLDRSAAVALTSKIMVISVIVLFVVIVFVLLLHVYAKWFWWQIEEEEDSTHIQQRPRRGRRFVFAPGQQLAGAAARRGLDPTVLQSLHAQVFQVKDFEEGLECAVCLCELEEGEMVRLLPKCNHGFHLDCIDLWFQSHTTCPICRNPVATDSSGVVSTETSIGQEVSFGSVEENFPTNVLFWGDENEVNSRTASSSVVEEGASSSSMAANDSMLVIDIPRQVMEELPCSSPSPGSEFKSPMAVRLRSLRRLLSGADRKVNPSSQSNCADDDAMV